MEFSDKQKQLLLILADGQNHSGTELAALLNLSRAAIWKSLHALMPLGIEVNAIKGKGYRLNAPLKLLDKKSITAQLIPEVQKLGVELEIFDQCESTNQTLLNAARQGCVVNKVCLAEHQTLGKGRRGRQWVAAFGQNIILSILWRFESGTAAIAGLSLAIGVAVIDALKSQGIEGVGLKWPNDLVWQNRKLGGILIEVSGESGGPCSVVIGLGLNGCLPTKIAVDINQAWVDLTQITASNTVDRNPLTAALMNQLLPLLVEFERTPLTTYLNAWRQYDCMRGKAVTVLLYNQVIQGVVEGINDEGLLLLQDEHGKTHAFTSGEISFNTQST